MDQLANLIGLYALVLLINVVLSAGLWLQQRTRLNAHLVWLWVAAAISFVSQGATAEAGALPIAWGFGFAFFVNLMLAVVLGELTRRPVPWKLYLGLWFAGMASAGVVASRGAPFWAISLPVSLVVAAPLLVTSIRTLLVDRQALTMAGRGLLLVAFAFIAHNLDFPVMRDKESLAAVGFTIAVVLVYALSVAALAVTMEHSAAERARIEELNRIKSRFFANISHELRTPLTLILGPAQRLAASYDEGEVRDSLAVIVRNAERLLRLIDDLLELSQLEVGVLRLRLGPVDVGALIESIGEMARPAAKVRGMKVEVMRPKGELFVYADPHRLEIVLTNLVSNAVKYAHSGGLVTISAEAVHDGVRIRVADRGPGISAAEQTRIFERFARLGEPGDEAGGVGIGLALAKELVQLHGGTLTLHSEEGRGSTFDVVLSAGREDIDEVAIERRHVNLETSLKRRAADDLSRLKLSSAPPPTPARGRTDPILLEGGRRARALVVEDEDDLRAFVVDTLSPECEVDSAANGEEALALVAERRPDLIVTDAMMPVMSGIELCKALRENPHTRTIPVILLTARAGADAAVEGYNAGASDFVAKPFHPRVLVARARAHLKERQLSLKLADHARLVTASTISAGVSHELRNPLHAILSSAVMLAEQEDTPAKRALVDVIAQSANRMNDVVESLTSYARPTMVASATEIDVGESVRASVRLLRHLERTHSVTIDVEGVEEARTIAPRAVVNQVVVNLIDNAARAAESTVWVSVSPGPPVRITVADDGPGVSAENASKIFDPFFTTRDVGEGTGLGLYVSRRLARDFGGELWYEPRRGGGARFVLELGEDSKS